MMDRRWLALLAVSALLLGACSSTQVLDPGVGGTGAAAGTGGSHTAGAGGEGATAGGGGDAGAGAVAGQGGGGGGPIGPCNQGDCAACGSSECAAALCEPAFITCANNAECPALHNCVTACSDPDCEYQCHSDHAGGVADYYALIDCLYCDADTCSVDCGPYCPFNPPPPAPCDIGDCSACGTSDCAYFWCGPEIDACFNAQPCVDFMNCRSACNNDPSCIQGCHTTHAAGTTPYYTMVNCLYCDVDTCSQDCAAYCPIDPPPPAPCDMGDCNACGSSNCAYFWCGPEIDACFNAQPCLDFMNCQSACNSDPTCIQGCHTTHAAGTTPYYTMVNCLYCDANTCSQDCAAYCPVSPPPPAPCDMGDCNACATSECAYFWCGLEVQACQNNPDCVDLANCYAGCSNPGCYIQCTMQYPGGTSDYDTMYWCLLCSPSTCSQDCAATCP